MMVPPKRVLGGPKDLPNNLLGHACLSGGAGPLGHSFRMYGRDSKNGQNATSANYTPSVVYGVLKRKHECKGKHLEVEQLYNWIGRVVSNERLIHFPPPPLTFMVDQIILEYLRNYTEELSVRMKEVNAKVKFMDEDKVTIEPSFSKKVSLSIYKEIPTWMENAKSVFQGYVEQFMSVSVTVPHKVWTFVRSKLKPDSNQTLQLIFDEASFLIRFTGGKQDVHVAEKQVDVIVNTVNANCDLLTSAVSRAIHSKAGYSVQKDISKKKPKNVKQGDIIETSAGKLNCKRVYHLCILGTPWDAGKGVIPILKKAIHSCLQKASKSKMTSIAIPAIGTDISQTLLRATDVATVPGKNLTLNTTEGKQINLVLGSLENQKVDVIVNTVNAKCDLSTGAVSKAVRSKAGKRLQKEINKEKPKAVKQGDIIETSGGELTFENVYHLCILDTNWGSGEEVKTLLRRAIDSCLQKASKSKMTSIAIPAIGTGNLNYPGDVVSQIIYEAVLEFSQNSSLNEIRIVVFEMDHEKYKGSFLIRVKIRPIVFSLENQKRTMEK
ncbi:protein mono-ADP-ribosyltransferase PARP14-like [Ptychodera flava]|uniref:protein mono-ADP-ribosyltransferase PARP14-like n=1 Tax=Ptychodera flava TaxID=63121 RepID=UPI003969BD07